MGSKERRERQRAETRQKILDAAREMFVRHGYEATTMRAIARRIEYTPTAIYHHFRSKDALLYELCDADFRALADGFRAAARVEDPVERLDRIGAAYVDFALTHPMHYQLLFMTRRPPLDELDGAAGRGDPGERAYAFLRQACAEAIAAGRFRPEYGDADEVAQMLWAGMHGIVSLQVTKQQEEWIEWRDARRTAARIREVMSRGLARGPTS
ncbi:MAG TPA: TetR/AcrR family transcriptional regulator [Longimicrobiales bacterium]